MSKRRSNGEGSITQRKDGRWQAIVSLPDGNRRSFYGQTRQGAMQKLRKALRAREDGLPLPSERLTVEAYFQDWLETLKPRVKPASWERYELDVRRRVIPHLGKMKLANLSAPDLQLLYGKCLESGLSPTSVRNLHRVISAALSQAVKWGLAQRNVASLASAPRRNIKEMVVLGREQVSGLLVAASGHRLEALFTLAVTSGMREGELLALRWKDVDLEDGALQVRATLRRTKAGFSFSEPKTARSRRQIILTQAALVALKRHRAAQIAERLRLGPAWEDNGLVFANEVGRPIEAQNVYNRSFKRLLRQAGLPDMRFHDLRHTAATLMLTQGVHPKVVSDMLGHATIAITLDLYSHVLPAMQKEAVQAMDALFGV